MTSRPANGYEVQRAGKHTLVKLADRDSGFGVGWPVNWLVKILVGSKHLGGLPLAADEVVLLWLYLALYSNRHSLFSAGKGYLTLPGCCQSSN